MRDLQGAPVNPTYNDIYLSTDSAVILSYIFDTKAELISINAWVGSDITDGYITTIGTYTGSAFGTTERYNAQIVTNKHICEKLTEFYKKAFHEATSGAVIGFPD